MGNFKVEPKDKQLFITLSGKFTPEDHPKFIAAFNDGVSKVTPKDTELVFDAGDFQVLSPDMHDKLAECFKLYDSKGFKKITMNIGANVFVSMQVKRIAKDVGLTNFEIK